MKLDKKSIRTIELTTVYAPNSTLVKTVAERFGVTSDFKFHTL